MSTERETVITQTKRGKSIWRSICAKPLIPQTPFHDDSPSPDEDNKPDSANDTLHLQAYEKLGSTKARTKMSAKETNSIEFAESLKAELDGLLKTARPCRFEEVR